MGRGPRRASGRRQLRAEPRHRDRGRGDQGRHASSALRMDQLEDYGAFLRAPMPGPLYRMHGAITGGYDIAECRRHQPRRAHQQDAGEPHPRLRRAAALSGAGAAGAADRDRAWARSSRRDQAQSRPGAQVSLPRRRRLALRFRRLSARGRDRDRRRPARRSQEAPRRGARGRPEVRHRLCRGGRARHVEHGLSLDAADARRRATRPARRTARSRWSRSTSIRSARCR